MSDAPHNPIVKARDGLEMPSLGLGTWMMGMDPSKRADEAAALNLGLDLGMTLIDTAENYGDGGSERVVGEAIRGRRDEVVVVTKVRPGKASRSGTIESAEQSLERLGTDRIDLLLLHGQPTHPLEETLEAFETLEREGKIRHYGVSNFDMPLMQALEDTPLGVNVGCNQLRYALTHRALAVRVNDFETSVSGSLVSYSNLRAPRGMRRTRLMRPAWALWAATLEAQWMRIESLLQNVDGRVALGGLAEGTAAGGMYGSRSRGCTKGRTSGRTGAGVRSRARGSRGGTSRCGTATRRIRGREWVLPEIEKAAAPPAWSASSAVTCRVSGLQRWSQVALMRSWASCADSRSASIHPTSSG